MQCQEVRELADAFIGEELLVETSHAIVRHLDTCPQCGAEIESRRTLRRQLRRAVLASAELAPRDGWQEAMEARLRQTGAPPARRRVPAAAWLALAATLLIAVGSAAV